MWLYRRKRRDALLVGDDNRYAWPLGAPFAAATAAEDRRGRAGLPPGGCMHHRIRAAGRGLALTLSLAAAGAAAQQTPAAPVQPAPTQPAPAPPAPAKSAAARNSEAAVEAEVTRFLESINTALAHSREGRYEQADAAFAEVFKHPAFAALGAGDRRVALAAAAQAAAVTGHMPRAIGLYRQAIAAENTPDDWYRLALVEYDLKHYEAAADAFVQLVEYWPESLAKVNSDILSRLQTELPHGSEQRLTLLRALYAANWSHRTADASPVWFALVEMLVERGRRDEARTVVKRIVDPMQLVRLRIDKRFDFLAQDGGWATDIANASRRQIEAQREKTELAPRSLDSRVQLSYALLTAGDDAGVLALAQDAGQRSDSDYDDPHQRAWLMNTAAIALRRLGRGDEAVAELERASRLTEDGLPNVSQTINLASLYCSLQRPDDALAALARIGPDLNAYARLVVQNVRLCAAEAKGDRRGADRVLRELSEKRKDGPRVYLESLLRMQRLDEAAALTAALLATQDERVETLLWLQEFRRPDPLPGDVAYREARKALLARADVQEAAAKVGRIGRYEVFGSGEMD
ncbi:hypothetical protein D9T17_05620 [Lysobacter enzymogenes]|uniref:Tetratricopeptide repeat protein n=1 Tax=Lysobacter enzymogenes TaxID=69 RepID=A0A3N2RL79_LYSEN|nr:hypothetical protein D9T17_05620 [Lysobacter enzymogenes]